MSKAKREKLRDYLKNCGFEVSKFVGNLAHEKYSFVCFKSDMNYLVKLGVDDEAGKRRVEGLKNEIVALKKLWQEFPDGETKAFHLPPGAEEIFDETYGDLEIYGYSRVYVDGKVLGEEMRAGREYCSDWMDKCADVVSEIDALPDLELPRTKKKEDTDFTEVVVENAKKWLAELEKLEEVAENIDTSLMKCMTEAVEKSVAYISGNRFVLGTVHGELTPDNVVLGYGSKKPYISSFGRLCQRYPRFFDVPWVYGITGLVFGDVETAKKLWEVVISNMKIKEIESLKYLSNILTVGHIMMYLKHDEGDLDIDCSIFF